MAPMLIALAAIRWLLWAQGTMCEHLITSIIIMMLLIRLHSTLLFADIPSTCLGHRCPPTSSLSPIINASELHYISDDYACNTILCIYIYIHENLPIPRTWQESDFGHRESHHGTIMASQIKKTERPDKALRSSQCQLSFPSSAAKSPLLVHIIIHNSRPSPTSIVHNITISFVHVSALCWDIADLVVENIFDFSYCGGPRSFLCD